MYLSFYKLRTKPFSEKTDPTRPWLNEKTKKKLDAFREGIIEDKGFMLLTGDVGTGKTSFINILVSSLPGNIVVGNVVNPGLDQQGFLQVLADIFHLTKKEGDQEELLFSFTEFLVATSEAGKKVLLIIDEAQQLNGSVLKLIQQLVDLDSEDNGPKLLNIILVCQNDFDTFLFRPENSDLRQKIAVTYNIVPLTKPETEQYIKHHLRLADGSEDIFSPEAMDAVFTFAGGSPRLINLSCDLALLSGFTSKSPIITKEIVSGSTKKLMLTHDKTTKPLPIAAHEIDTIDEQPCSRRQTGWMKPSYGLLILFVLMLFGARQLFIKMEIADSTETKENLPAYNETTATPKAEIPMPVQTLRELATSQPSKPAAAQLSMPQPATEALPAEAVTAKDSTAPNDEAMNIAAKEDAPPVIHVQPLENIETKAKQTTIPKSATETTPAAAVTAQDSDESKDEAIQIDTKEKISKVVHVQPQENIEPKAKPAKLAKPATDAPPAAAATAQDTTVPKDEAIQIVAVTASTDYVENRTTHTSPDRQVLKQEKPLPVIQATPPEINTTPDHHNESKKVLTVYFGNLRDGPSMKANIIDVCKRGDVVTDMRKKGKWHFVKLDDGRLGWMHRFLFAKQKITTGKGNIPEIKAAVFKRSL